MFYVNFLLQRPPDTLVTGHVLVKEGSQQTSPNLLK